MPSSSPYQNNDYQSLSTYRPYRLPINDIAKASVALDEFWKRPAQRIKSMYDNAAGLELTLQPNKDIRDLAIEDAKKRIEKLSTMDLRDPNVQKQASNLFKDLYNDEGVMTDHAATTHISRVNNTALSYVQRENGKFYSPVNHKYALSGADEFRNSQDRMAGKAFLNQKKEYEQFYDPAIELNEILKNCKPNIASNDVVEGMYIKSYSEESLSAQKINSCLDSGLSERAKRQLQINGVVTYKSNPEALRDKYIPHLQNTRSSLAESQAAIQGILANKDNLRNLKPEQLAKIGITDIRQITPDLIKRIDEQSRNIDGRILNLDNTVSKLLSGDLTPIQGENFEPIAALMYSRDYMQNVGEGFSYDFQKNTKRADPVQLAYFTQNQLNARQEDDQQHDRDIEEMKLQNDLKLKLLSSSSSSLKALLKMGPDGQMIIDAARVQNDTNSPFSTIASSDAYDRITEKRVEVQNQINQLNQAITQEARDFGLPASIQSINSPEGKAWFDTFKITAKGDPTKEEFIQRYEGQRASYDVANAAYKATQDIVDSNPEVRGLEASSRQKIIGMEPIRVGDIVVTGQDVYNALTGAPSPLRIQNAITGITTSNSAGVPGTTGYVPGALYYNGVEIPSTYGQVGNELWQRISSLRAASSTALSKIKRKKNELMAQETILQREGYLFTNLNEKDNPLKLKIAQAINLPSNYIEKLTIGQTDLDGQLIVSLAPAKKSETDYDQEAMLEKLLTYNATNNEKIKDDPNSVLLKGITDLDLIDNTSTRLTEILPTYIKRLEKKANINQNQSTMYLPSIDGREYRISISATNNGGYIYKIIDKEAPTSPIASFTDMNRALQVLETRLTKRGQ